MRPDIIIIGAGIAGASAAYELSLHHRVHLLEKEQQPGYHATGRSSAFFSEAYGNATVRALTRASRAFFQRPPNGFCQSALCQRVGALYIAREDQMAQLTATYNRIAAHNQSVYLIGKEQIQQRAPMLRKGYAAAALWEPNSMALDVNEIHQSFLSGLKARGGRLHINAEVTELRRHSSVWQVRTSQKDYHAPIVINAAGAWADKIGQLAGASTINLVPLRRTVVVFNTPGLDDNKLCPLVFDIDEKFYFKQDTTRILCSPADESPMSPCDVQADDLDIALAIDRTCRAANFQVERIASKWAGLRSFVADKSPVVGFDNQVKGFFWLAAQGGYGISTAPALAKCCCALVNGQQLSKAFNRLDVTEAHLSPMRFENCTISKGVLVRSR